MGVVLRRRRSVVACERNSNLQRLASISASEQERKELTLDFFPSWNNGYSREQRIIRSRAHSVPHDVDHRGAS